MNIPLGPLFGLARIKDAFKKDRGVLGSDSRMESKDRSEKRLNSSQGKTKPWLLSAGELSWRMKRFVTESSSIHLFFMLIVTLFLFARYANANQMPAIDREKIMEQYNEVGENFEAMMLNFMYKQMRQSNTLVNKGDNNPFAPSNAELIYRSMHEQNMVESLAKTGPLGVKKIVVDRLQGRGGISGPGVVEYKNRVGQIDQINSQEGENEIR